MHACRQSNSTASQQGHLAATCSSILMKRLPIFTNYDAERVRWRRHAVAPAPCRLLYQALTKALVWLLPSGSSGPGGRVLSGSWFDGALCAACRSWLTSLPNFYWAFLELVGTAPCAASMSASGGVEGLSPLTFFSYAHYAPLSALKLRETAPRPEPFRSNLSATRGIRWR